MKSLDDVVRDTVRQALGIVRNVDAVDAVRERAAELVASILHGLDGRATEADLADVMVAAAAVLGVGRHTTRTLAAAILHADTDRQQAPAAVARLAARALDHGHGDAFVDLVIVLLRAGHDLPEDWPACAIHHALGKSGRSQAVSVVRAWLDDGKPSDAPWLVAAIKEHSERILTYPMLRDDHLGQIQIAVPTIIGWLELLKRADEVEHSPISATEFGVNLDRARRALEQAMEQTTPGGRITLASWLVQLVGDVHPAVEAVNV